MSYIWYTALAVLTVVVVGTIVSLITGAQLKYILIFHIHVLVMTNGVHPVLTIRQIGFQLYNFYKGHFHMGIHVLNLEKIMYELFK